MFTSNCTKREDVEKVENIIINNIYGIKRNGSDFTIGVPSEKTGQSIIAELGINVAILCEDYCFGNNPDGEL